MTTDTDLTPPDPHWQERVRSYADFPVFGSFFQVQPLELHPGIASAGLDYRKELSFRDGWFQGAITSAMAEIVAVWACATMAQPDHIVMSLEQAVKFVGPANGDRLFAEGRLISGGRSIMYAQADVFVLSQSDRRLCATMTTTCRQMARRD